jgi:hypothetical protein
MAQFILVKQGMLSEPHIGSASNGEEQWDFQNGSER